MKCGAYFFLTRHNQRIWICATNRISFFFFFGCVSCACLCLVNACLWIETRKEKKNDWQIPCDVLFVLTHTRVLVYADENFCFFFFVSTRRITYQHLWQKTIFTCIHADRLQKTKTSSNYYFRSWLLFFFSYIYKFRFRFDRADTWYTHTHRTHRINTKHEVNAQFDRKRNGTAAIEPNRISK